MDALKLFKGVKLVPVIVISDQQDAVELARTLLAAGIGAMEITLRTDTALACIREVAKQVPDMLVGAGSIRKPEQFGEIIDAGARFAVSPGSNPGLLKQADKTGLPFVPGAVTATEVLHLLEAGYELQKFFPAELAGGVKMIQALAAPIPEVRFFPTGGVNLNNLNDYLALANVNCVGGSWFVPGDALEKQDFERIASLAQEAVRQIGD